MTLAEKRNERILSVTEDSMFTRDVGSQREVPVLDLSDNEIRVHGYQEYRIHGHDVPRLTVHSRHSNKLKLVRRALRSCRKELSIADLGCSNGLVGISLLLSNFDNVVFVDHDVECIDVVERILEHLKLEGGSVRHCAISSYEGTHDVVCALAIVHWLYSATESFGSMDRVVRHLANMTSDLMLVEWISPYDPAVRLGRHFDRNEGVTMSPYNRRNFRRALKESFTATVRVGNVSSTRVIFLASKSGKIVWNRRQRAMLLASAVISYPPAIARSVTVLAGRLLPSKAKSRIRSAISIRSWKSLR